MDAIAIINYPGHFVSTLGTIKNFLEITHWRAPIYIFVDDQGPQWEAWENYLEDLDSAVKTNFGNLDVNYVKFSEFGFPYIWDGWLRQQLVKLNLEKFLPGDLWYVTDGDVRLARIPGPNEIPYNFASTHNTLINAQQHTYITYMLGDVNSLCIAEQVYTHHVPCRWVTRNDLEELKFYVSKRLGNDFNIEHFNLMREERIIGYGPTPEHLSMTEWDLLEIWRINIDKQYPEFKYWLISRDTPTSQTELTTFDTFFGTDQDFNLEHFTSQGLVVTQEQWQKCQTISRT